jgi:hypothetical protein
VKELVAILGKALLWGAGISAVVFVLAFIGPLMVGGPGAHQAPLAAFLFAPVAFPLVLLVVYVLQYRRALRLSGAGKSGYAVVLVLLLIPAVSAARFLASLDLPVDTARYGRQERFRHAAPMTDDERRLRESTHFDLRVRVENPRFPPVYTGVLVTDLAATGLFRVVDARVTPETADLVATVTGSYYGDKQGLSFTLRRADGQANELQLKVYYIVGGIFSQLSDRRQYLDRLAVEVIRAVQTLQATTPQ